MSWENLNDYRWRLRSGMTLPSITVIDSAEKKEPPANAWRVPFGFSRVLAPPPVEPEPLLWEGED